MIFAVGLALALLGQDREVYPRGGYWTDNRTGWVLRNDDPWLRQAREACGYDNKRQRLVVFMFCMGTQGYTFNPY